MALLHRSFAGALLTVSLATGTAAAREPKPEKVPVALGAWKGPSASTFKSAMRRGLAKECKVVGAKGARVVVEGEVAPAGKGFVVRAIVRQPRTNELLQQREFKFAKAKASAGQSNKMGHFVAEVARRTPAD
jgi:hypothetical protein